MVSDTLQKSGSPTAFTWGSADDLLENLANGDAVSSDPITDASPSIRRYLISASIAVHVDSAPNANSLIKFYLSRIVDGKADGGISTSVSEEHTEAADVNYIERSCQFVQPISVAATVNITYTTSFVIEDPGIAWALIIVNNTGQALGADGTHEVNYVTLNPEAQ